MTEILYIEDNPADVELWRDTLTGLPSLKVRAVADGAQALDYLRQAGSSADTPQPDLILLDVSLPRIDGHQVLAEIKSDPALRTIPVIVLSSSAQNQEIERAYLLGANAYVVKPTQLSHFREMVRAIYHFWCRAASSPRNLPAGR
ncbi:MAG TPA: response regulator [Gemmatimonadales bacterium]|jgi:CheY-like chemotaxis protein|nr:response regulator [Gemmatimonadales bacterium]